MKNTTLILKEAFIGALKSVSNVFDIFFGSDMELIDKDGKELLSNPEYIKRLNEAMNKRNETGNKEIEPIEIKMKDGRVLKIS
ncbi:hypothetical protein ETU10_08535 [Apibacter muscae]|uniref:Uncharacterized protein n=1 Tax=Apibacter muscae TaxID=2509004 RepID=A0A563D9T0_9FLAO|nr:hypothetical protein [Apibacter muscae]TWP23133.1 hypothetical protein ETU10_08535 [Apibacter muscae]TWP27068.1 hypothetical protein ETU09_08080 [Apibacter muscae]